MGTLLFVLCVIIFLIILFIYMLINSEPRSGEVEKPEDNATYQFIEDNTGFHPIKGIKEKNEE